MEKGEKNLESLPNDILNIIIDIIKSRKLFTLVSKHFYSFINQTSKSIQIQIKYYDDDDIQSLLKFTQLEEIKINLHHQEIGQNFLILSTFTQLNSILFFHCPVNMNDKTLAE